MPAARLFPCAQPGCFSRYLNTQERHYGGHFASVA